MADQSDSKGVNVDIHLHVHFNEGHPQGSTEIDEATYEQASRDFERSLAGTGRTTAETVGSFAASERAITEAMDRAYENYLRLK